MRFLGRQNRQINRKVRYMLDAYHNISSQNDPEARTKAVEMLTNGLGISDVSKHRKAMIQLDNILNRRNTIAHPTVDPTVQTQLSRLTDRVIKNLERHKTLGVKLLPDDELMLLCLQCSEHIMAVRRLNLLPNVV
jgi:hypothetical protein